MINDLNIPSADGIFKYVDDTTIHEVVIEKGSNSLMQSLINEVSEWSRLNKFQLHPKKYKELWIFFAISPRTYPKLDIANNRGDIV